MKNYRDAFEKIYFYLVNNGQHKAFHDLSMHTYFRLEFCFDEKLENVYDSVENKFLEMMGVKPNGYRPVNFVEDRFLEKMGVEPRCAEN